jgi:hypothetical protein
LTGKTNSMKRHWKAVFTLLVISPLFAELVSGNTSLGSFFTPLIFISFVTIGYGFPILVIREVVVRNNFGVLSLFFLGLIYGIYNEGLLAKTLFNPYNSPMSIFALYGLVSNVRIPWTIVITCWHALYAVMYPIIFVRYLFPCVSQEVWIGKKATWFLGGSSLVFGVITFLNVPLENLQRQVVYLFFMITVSIIFLLFAKKMNTVVQITESRDFSLSWKRAVGIGFWLCDILFLVPIILVGVGIPVFIFVVYYSIAVGFFMYKMYFIKEISNPLMMCISLGGMSMVSFTVVLVSIFSHQNILLLTSSIFFIGFVSLAKRVQRNFLHS